jgi:hypothetical protein
MHDFDIAKLNSFIKSLKIINKNFNSDKVRNSSLENKISKQMPESEENLTDECCRKILVIDDSPFNVQSLSLILKFCFDLECDIVRIFTDILGILRFGGI